MRSFYHIKPLWAAVIVSTAITTWLGTLLGKKNPPERMGVEE